MDESRATLIVVSDLHLAGNGWEHVAFHTRQTRAFADLLQACAPGGILNDTLPVELIINGDWLDCLRTTPVAVGHAATVDGALERLEHIAMAHEAFFVALRAFLAIPGNRITALIGNHDIELALPAVQQRLAVLLGDREGHFRVWPARGYRPWPDVYIEHGNQLDPWNASTSLWDETGEPRSPDLTTALLPVGSRYFLDVLADVYRRYPYLDVLTPSLSPTKQLALLCLLDPHLVCERAQAAAASRGNQRRALAELPADQTGDPPAVFSAAVRDLHAQLRAVRERSGIISADTSAEQAQVDRLHAALRDGPEAAAQAIFAWDSYEPQGSSGSIGQIERALAAAHPEARYILCGHTHAEFIAQLPSGQWIANTGTWCSRRQRPTVAEARALLPWLQHPNMEQCPLTDATQLTFALLHRRLDAGTALGLYAWEDHLHDKRAGIPIPLVAGSAASNNRP